MIAATMDVTLIQNILRLQAAPSGIWEHLMLIYLLLIHPFLWVFFSFLITIFFIVVK